MRNTAGFPVLHIEAPAECQIMSRVNRFVVKVNLQGKDYLACINNTGRLGEFLVPGRKGFCTRNKKPGKTDYRLFAIEESGLGAIIDTRLQMRAFENVLNLGLLPWLEGYRILKRDVRLGNSLIDYLLDNNNEKVYLEVKSAVLRECNYAMYPDCPSVRGRKHVRELISHIQGGGKAVLLFAAALPDVTAFKPYKQGDPEIYESLVAAQKVGVEIKAIGMAYHPQDGFIYLYDDNLKIDLS